MEPSRTSRRTTACSKGDKTRCVSSYACSPQQTTTTAD
jgi:hypothetical protein